MGIELSGEQKKSGILEGYNSIFDRMATTDETEKETIKKELAHAVQGIQNAWTLQDLYTSTKEIVSLPDASTEDEICKNFNMLWDAVGKIDWRDTSPQAHTAYLIIDNQVMLRYNTIKGGPQSV